MRRLASSLPCTRTAHCDSLQKPTRASDAFKTRAAKLEAAIKKELPSTTVTINPEKPRKGCFEVTVGSSVVLSLLNMPRPFPKLKALDIEGKVADDVIKALK